MRLNGNAGRCERPGFGEAANDRVGIKTAACGLEETERRLQNVVGGSPSERGEVDGYSPIFSGVSRLERFRHGTEIISEPPAFGGDNTQRVLSLQHIQPPQLRASRGAAERSACAGGMKTFVVVTSRDVLGNLAFDFHADVVSQHEVFPGSPSQLTNRERWWEHTYRGMRKQAVNAILCCGKLSVIVIIGVDGNSIGKRRKARMGFHPRANNAGFHVAQSERLHVLTHQRPHAGARAGERQTKTIQDGLLAPIEYI